MILGIILAVLLMIELLYLYYYHRWEHLWALEEREQVYKVKQPSKDALKLIVIGDSWAGLHSKGGLDSFLQSHLAKQVMEPVSVKSRGKGGEKTKGIYHLIYESGEYGLRPLLTDGADYCVVFAGINDAAANLGTRQYCYYYRLIIDFLLTNHIRPVLVEIPNVNIWQIYGDKPIKDLLSDYVKSKMTNCRMYSYKEYREALFTMLTNEHLIEKILYVKMDEWDPSSPQIDRDLFMDDQIHLNRKGYEVLDSCIAKAVAEDFSKVD